MAISYHDMTTFYTNLNLPWKIDENRELPLAIIEDTEDGMGVIELGEHTERNVALANRIVEDHNKSIL